MYFIKRDSNLYHIVGDAQTWTALCGQVADRLDIWEYQQGKETEKIKAEKPAGKPLCKHCARLCAASVSVR